MTYLLLLTLFLIPFAIIHNRNRKRNIHYVTALKDTARLPELWNPIIQDYLKVVEQGTLHELNINLLSTYLSNSVGNYELIPQDYHAGVIASNHNALVNKLLALLQDTDTRLLPESAICDIRTALSVLEHNCKILTNYRPNLKGDLLCPGQSYLYY